MPHPAMTRTASASGVAAAIVTAGRDMQSRTQTMSIEDGTRSTGPSRGSTRVSLITPSAWSDHARASVDTAPQSADASAPGSFAAGPRNSTYPASLEQAACHGGYHVNQWISTIGRHEWGSAAPLRDAPDRTIPTTTDSDVTSRC